MGTPLNSFDPAFVDHYEALEISPNATPDTIHRIYRLLAQRFHPDNRETGDEQRFRAITEAYKILGDPERRAPYDVIHRDAWKQTWRVFDQGATASGVEGEKQKRHSILTALYRKRAIEPEQPTLNGRDLEVLLGVPREHLEFSLWFLKDSQCVQRTDNNRYCITVKGAELAEEWAERNAAPPRPLLAGARG